MSDFYLLPPNQHENATDLSDEYYRDVPLPTTNSLPNISQEHPPASKTEPFASISQQYTGKLTAPTTTAPLVVSDITTTQSLVTALQATIQPKATRTVVVIPGAKKRGKTVQETPSSTRHMHPR